MINFDLYIYIHIYIYIIFELFAAKFNANIHPYKLNKIYKLKFYWKSSR